MSSTPNSPRSPGRAGLLLLHLRRAFAWDLRGLPIAPSERAYFVARGVEDETVQRYLVWRRSVLLVLIAPAGIMAYLYHLDALDNNFRELTLVGLVVFGLGMLSLYVMPLAALAAALFWSRQRRSRRVMFYGWLLAFMLPLFLALFPVDWLIALDALSTHELPVAGHGLGSAILEEIRRHTNPHTEQQFVRFLVGAEYFLNSVLMVMLVLLTVIPGTLRAGLRIKALLPETTMSGWFLVIAPFFYSLLMLPVFVGLNQVASNPLLISGTMLLMGAPAVYVAYGGLFVRPLTTPAERSRIGQVQWLTAGLTTLAWGLLLLYALTRKIPLLERTLIGLDPATSLVRPWNWYILRSMVEYTGRSLFTTVLVADLLMVVNLAVWRDLKRLAEEETGRPHDQLMHEMRQVLTR